MAERRGRPLDVVQPGVWCRIPVVGIEAQAGGGHAVNYLPDAAGEFASARAEVQQPGSAICQLKNGKPNGVKNWYKRLRLSAGLQNEVALLFDGKSANIRNKVMHGALLDIDTKHLARLAGDRLETEPPTIRRRELMRAIRMQRGCMPLSSALVHWTR